jgi:hypothetical protein
MAECLAAWFIQHRLNLPAKARPEKASGKNVDFEVIATARFLMRVEVKAPYVPRTSDNWAGDDHDVIRTCREKAGDQFKKEHANLLVIVPLVRTPVYVARSQLVEALIGQRAWSVPVIRDPGDERLPTETVFLQNGRLAKRWPSPSGDFKTHLTRISAVLSIEETVLEDEHGNARVQHSALVVHNPFAAHPIAIDSFGDLPQFVPVVGEMAWTDGYSKAR